MSMKPLLEIRHLHKRFKSKNFEMTAVKDFNLTIYEGETVGLMGQSGSGKSTIGKCIVKLHEATSGEIIYKGVDICKMSQTAFRPYRKEIQIVFQDPYSSLNPRMTIEEIISEALDIHEIGTRDDRRKRVEELLGLVGLNSHYAHRYPHELSGGQRQRIGIARALAVNPKFLVLDEPLSALDVSIQAQIINLLKDLQVKLNLTYLFISHDLAVVRYLSTRIVELKPLW